LGSRNQGSKLDRGSELKSQRPLESATVGVLLSEGMEKSEGGSGEEEGL